MNRNLAQHYYVARPVGKTLFTSIYRPNGITERDREMYDAVEGPFSSNADALQHAMTLNMAGRNRVNGETHLPPPVSNGHGLLWVLIAAVIFILVVIVAVRVLPYFM